MKKLISALLILASSLALGQTTPSLLLKSNITQKTDNFSLRKNPKERKEYLNAKFLKSQNLPEKTNISIDSVLSEKYETEMIKKIRPFFTHSSLKFAQQDTTLIDSVCVFTFSTLNDSVLNAKILFTYNTEGNQQTFLLQELDTFTQQLKNTSKEEYFLDQNYSDTLLITYVWDNELNKWVNEGKHVTVYDDKGNRTLSVFYNWQNFAKQWIGVFKFRYEYDKNGNKTLDEYYTWNESINNWQGYNKSENQYDENNNLIMYAYYQWDYISNIWIGTYKNENGYDANGYLNSIISSIWDENKKDWKYRLKSVWHSESNENGYSGFSEYYKWNENKGKWEGDVKLASFTTDENEIGISYVWNIADEIWEQSQKTIYTKDSTGLKHTNNIYQAKDSLITGTMINGFNSSTDLSKIQLFPLCPDKLCTILDSDSAEGDSALLWNYNFVGSYNPDSGFCQIGLDNKIDFSDNSSLFINYKVIKPFKSIFIIRLIESSGEVWKAETPYIFNELKAEWNQLTIPFSNFGLTGNYANGNLNKESIAKIELRIYVQDNLKVSGSVLLDNFSSCNIKKTDTWLHSFTDELFHDEKGNSILTIQSRWDSLSKELIPYYKYKNEYTYNENGLIIKKISSYWKEFSLNWTNEMRYIYEYDDSGNLTKTEFYGWNEFNSNWFGYGKTETSWDEFGNTILSINYGWDYESATWLPINKSEYSYDSTGLQLINSFYFWDNVTKKWIGNSKSEIILNVNQEQIKTINYEWNYSENDWRVSYMYQHSRQNETYNEEGLVSSMITSNWDENLNIWSPTEKYYFYYSIHSISTNIKPLDSIENELVEVFPNPASDLLFIRFKNEVPYGSYSLFNTIGQLQRNAFITDKITTLKVSNLPPGNYYLILDLNHNKTSKKLIIR